MSYELNDEDLAILSNTTYDRVLGHVHAESMMGPHETELVHDRSRGVHGYAVRTRAREDAPWSLHGNGTLGGVWLGIASATASFLNRTMPGERRFVVTLD